MPTKKHRDLNIIAATRRQILVGCPKMAALRKGRQQHKLFNVLAQAILVAFIYAFFIFITSAANSSLVPSSQIQILLHLQSMLESPRALQNWSEQTDFCNLPPTDYLTIVCEGDSVTLLKIVGDRGSSSHQKMGGRSPSDSMLSTEFSSDSLALLLSGLSDLKVLQLVSLGLWGPLSSKFGRLSSLRVLNMSSNFLSGPLPKRFMAILNLQTLALDDNLLSGSLPQHWDSLHFLSTLILSNNKLSGPLPPSLFTLPNLRTVVMDNNLLNGSLPISLSNAQNLQVLSLFKNQLSGNLPDLTALTSLQALNVENNALGPQFPLLGNQLLYLALGRNRLLGPIPKHIGNLSLLQQLDLSYNLLSGVPPVSLFTLPNIQFLDMARNHLSGVLPHSLTFAKSMKLLDISFNLFSGPLPREIVSSLEEGILVRYQRNCFSTKVQPQYPDSFCQAAALASGINPNLSNRSSRRSHIALIAGVVGGALGFCLLTALAILLIAVIRKCKSEKPLNLVSAVGGDTSAAFSSELLSNARYISQTMKLGALGLPQYRVFSLRELNEATNDFSPEMLLGEGSRGKVYKGRLDDGTFVAVKCLSSDADQSTRSLELHLELLSKLRHRHLVGLLGHCLESEDNDLSGSRVFLIFEFVCSGTLQSRLTGNDGRDKLSWLQRLLVVIGAAKGIHFLHSGVVPGVFNNDLKTTNILLDESLVAKVSDYGLPKHLLLDSDSQSVVRGNGFSQPDYFSRKKLADKKDVFNFGLILLETILGRPPTLENSANGPRVKEMGFVMVDRGPSLDLIDPKIMRTCTLESLTTVLEIAVKCLSQDIACRPSMEDILWNLQYALQVQDNSSGEFQSDINESFVPQTHLAQKEKDRDKRRIDIVEKTSNEEVGKPSSPNTDFFR